MTRENTVNVPHPLDGAFITTESTGNADPAKRTGVFKVAFSGNGCIERLHAAEDYLKGLVEADRAAPLHEGEGEPVAWLYTENKWKDGPRHRLSIKRQGVSDEDANEFEITETPLYAAPPPSVEVFGSSSLKGEDTHRVAETAVVGLIPVIDDKGFTTLHEPNEDGEAGDLVASVWRDDWLPRFVKGCDGCDHGWPIHTHRPTSNPYGDCPDCVNGICSMNCSSATLVSTTAHIAHDMRMGRFPSRSSPTQFLAEQAAVSTAEQVGTSEAREPNPSVEVERLRDVLAQAYVDYQNGAAAPGDTMFDFMAKRVSALQAALSRKQEPGVPTPGAWIEWSGGENPCGDDMVEIKCRGGYSMVGMASAISWTHPAWPADPKSGNGDIIAYRIVPTPGGEGE